MKTPTLVRTGVGRLTLRSCFINLISSVNLRAALGINIEESRPTPRTPFILSKRLIYFGFLG